MSRTTKGQQQKGHADPDTYAEGTVEIAISTGNPADETSGRFVAAYLHTFTDCSGGVEATITIKQCDDGSAANEEKIDQLTVADARALVTCLEAILAKVPMATRFVREGEQVPPARGMRITA